MTLRENMSGAKEHNRWQLLTMRRTIETRFSVLCALYDIQRPLAGSLIGLQLSIEKVVLA